MNRVILLTGLPAVGKYTTAQELRNYILEEHIDMDDVILLDNHFFNNIIFPYVNKDKYITHLFEPVYQIRDIFLDTISKYHDKNRNIVYIFTNVLVDTKEDMDSLYKLRKFSEDIQASFDIFYLQDSKEHLLRNCESEDRAKRFKLTNPDMLDSFISNTKFITVEDLADRGFPVTAIDMNNFNISELYTIKE